MNRCQGATPLSRVTPRTCRTREMKANDGQWPLLPAKKWASTSYGPVDWNKLARCPRPSPLR
jgi:hypothetical protein